MIEVTAATLARQRSLQGMPADQLEELAASGTEVLFPPGHRIFADGDYADKFWLVESGYVQLDVAVPGEGLAVVGRSGIGGLLGWSWLLPPYRWMFGAVCVTEVRAFQFDAPTVRERCADDPVLRDELTRRLFYVVQGRVRDARTTLVARGIRPRSPGLDVLDTATTS